MSNNPECTTRCTCVGYGKNVILCHPCAERWKQSQEKSATEARDKFTCEIHKVEPVELPEQGVTVMVFLTDFREPFKGYRCPRGTWRRSADSAPFSAPAIAWTDCPTITGGTYRVRRLTQKLPDVGKDVLVQVSWGSRNITAHPAGPVERKIGKWNGSQWECGYLLDANFVVTAWCELPEMA